jgi:hypothetical protein
MVDFVPKLIPVPRYTLGKFDELTKSPLVLNQIVMA